MNQAVAFLFDLDGTLVDSVYNHVRAWHVALREHGLDLSVWRIHRKIGMSGGLFTAQLQRELGRPIDEATIEKLRDRHAELFRELSQDVPPLDPSARLTLLDAIDDIRNTNQWMDIVAGQLVWLLADMKLLPSEATARDYLAQSGTVAFCRAHRLPLRQFSDALKPLR